MLFVDKEIQFQIKHKKLFYNNNHEEQKNTILHSDINKIYSHRQNVSFISSFKFKEEKTPKKKPKIKNIRQSSQASNSTRFATPITKDIGFQKVNSENITIFDRNVKNKKIIDNNFLLSSNIINIDKNLYSIKKISKPSSIFHIYRKLKTDKKFLLNLCNNLKIIKNRNLHVNRQTKSKLSCFSCVLSYINRGESLPIKKAKKKQSCRIKQV